MQYYMWMILYKGPHFKVTITAGAHAYLDVDLL